MIEESLFAAALERPPGAERRAFLDAACGGDAQLRDRVERLLAADEHTRGILDPGPPVTSTLPQEPPAEPTTRDLGSAVGPYKLVQELGEGGMGTVYLAQQSDPIRRLVALKVIKAGMDSRQVVARFEAERQALALMDHPNIAKVFAGGITPDGRPYFVMELVKGVPITKFCDDHKLTPRDRLGLFVQVCEAVQHAHQKGVIHRDLKPTNVLVAEYDGRPVPKVIDFGVAKAAGQPLTEKTLVTGLGSVVGTLEYMSPEQADLNQLDVDTRSDIYSLGVLLYELLTGTTPIDRARFRKAALLEMLRLVREEEPQRPSARLSSTDARAGIAAVRGMEPARLAKAFRGELDWIALKALEKDRARRYETANALARDVQRYLADEVVEARPPSAGYRVRKLLRRYRGRVAAGTLILIGLIGGLLGTAYGLLEAGNQRVANTLRERAERDRDAAEVARGEAETARDGEKAARAAADSARKDAETARDGEKTARAEVEREKEKLAVIEYGRTMQIAYQAWHDNNILTARTLLESTRPDLRGWEWHYVHRLCHSDLLTLKGHTSHVSSAAFSPDGDRVVTASADRTARVWNVTTGAVLVVLQGHTAQVSSAAFSPDGFRVVTASADRTARVWDARTGAVLRIFEGHGSEVSSAAFSPDGFRVVTASADKTARIWDADTGAERLVLNGHTGPIFSAVFSRDGAWVVTAGSDKTARVWSARNGTELFAFTGHTGGVTSAAFSPDRGRVVTASGDGTAQVWDTITRASRGGPLKGHETVVRSAAFSPDGARVVTAGADKTARVWGAFSGTAELILKGHTEAVLSAAFSPDGSRVVTASFDRTVRVWDAGTGAQPYLLLGHQKLLVQSAGISPDGERVVAASGATAHVWDVQAGTQLLVLNGHGEPISSASFSPDGGRVVTASADKTARVWDARTGDGIAVLRGHTDRVTSARFSRDGTRIVTGGADGTARVWDTRTGAELVALKGHWQPVHSAAFSPDGARVVTASGDATARIWDARTGTVLRVWAHAEAVHSAAFSPDGSRVVTASGDATARIWDADTGAEWFVLRGHGSQVRSAAFSPDGTRVVTGGADATVRVWDARTGAELLALKWPEAVKDRSAETVEYSRDGARLLTVTQRGLAQVWDCRPVNRAFLPRDVALPVR
jgi:WD40 repeat protein/serine/threonine protein kinase